LKSKKLQHYPPLDVDLAVLYSCADSEDHSWVICSLSEHNQIGIKNFRRE
jgi:hypothetical protein